MIVGAKLIKCGAYATAVAAIGVVLNFGYEQNAWAGDIDRLERKSQLNNYRSEERTLSRAIFRWNMKPTSNASDERYKESMVKQLESERDKIDQRIQNLEN